LATSIFSTYSTGENRVTASILAVLKSLSLSRIERLLGALLEQSEFELVRFQNQPAKGGEGVPDGEILSSCRVLVETKIKRNSVSAAQLQRHLTQLNSSQEATRILLVLTPDQSRPPAIDRVEDPENRLVWASFAALEQAINELLADAAEVVSEREAFLLRELQAMLAEEGLIRLASEAVVVAARHAWPEYQWCHAYICQPGRAFRLVERIAFYSLGQVHELVPKILDMRDDVVLERGRHKGRWGELVDQLIDERSRSKKEVGLSYKVFLLSAPDDKQTLRLERPIPNDIQSKTGQPTAYTMGQRYVSIEKLLRARTTSELT
jgi:hypothetical protein